MNHNQPQIQDFCLISNGYQIAPKPFALSDINKQRVAAFIAAASSFSQAIEETTKRAVDEIEALVLPYAAS